MPDRALEYTLIEHPRDLDAFYQEHRNLPWMAFDTEFVGEKRFHTLLCLIQVNSEKGLFLIDPIRLGNLDPFLDLITDPKITKITHAGDNDYRLLNNLFDIVPSNVFDTQIAAGFVGYNYPVSFRRLVEGELGVHLKKGYAVTDWEGRPFQSKQLRYALNDVLFLPDLRGRLEKKLEKQKRTHWAEEELALLEKAEYYYRDPNDEAIKSNLMRSLKPKEQVFLLRLFAWRRKLAEERDHSKEMVLPAKYISQIVRSISSGREALKHNRRIPGRTAEKYGGVFEELYNRPISDEEREILKRIPSEMDEDPKEQIIMEMLYQVIKYKCLEEDISINMVVPRGELRKIRADEDDALELLAGGWRQEMLGAYFLDWLSNANRMKVDLLNDRIVIHPEEH
ncbi:MAG: HRDC domain-containing protein [Phaeodactylibacter sp.]|nr:HRDC domain-containing protein [Phaeodactylibacter sp.]MCB9050404.1 HRDC domain-containing protein [Lewinellaceae bacterium]